MKTFSLKFICFAVISLTFGCNDKKNQTTEQNLSEPSVMYSSPNQTACPQTVTLTQKTGGFIIIDWNDYVKNTNTFITVTVVPHDSKLTTDVMTNSTISGTFTLTKEYVAGDYSVYYTLQPGSSQNLSCFGSKLDVKFL